MPGLNTSLHLDMWRSYKQERSLVGRMRRVLRGLISGQEIYGLQWGDPEVFPPLQFIRDRYVLPYVDAKHVALEVGPGGGRWTRYLTGFQRLYVVDFHIEILADLKRHFNASNMVFVTNNGHDFPEIPDHSIDYFFSFGCFVHLDADLIASYLLSLRRVLKVGGNALVHYSDKTKVMAQRNPTFSANCPEQMRGIVTGAGFRILEEDLTTMWHSSIIRFTL
jgi:hypothetical protein